MNREVAEGGTDRSHVPYSQRSFVIKPGGVPSELHIAESHLNGSIDSAILTHCAEDFLVH